MLVAIFEVVVAVQIPETVGEMVLVVAQLVVDVAVVPYVVVCCVAVVVVVSTDMNNVVVAAEVGDTMAVAAIVVWSTRAVVVIAMSDMVAQKAQKAANKVVYFSAFVVIAVALEA